MMYCQFNYYYCRPTNILILLLIISTTTAALVIGPPKIELTNSDRVWYHIPLSGQSAKFALECDATNDPEEFRWQKNGQPFNIDGDKVIWQRPGQSGTIVFMRPDRSDQGYYQCFIGNIYGTAVSKRIHVQLGVLEHFKRQPIRQLQVVEGTSLTVQCTRPQGTPTPSVFWLYRDTQLNSVIETIRRKHITVDGDGNLQFASVKEHDGRANLIYQCAATSPVLQGEYRAGDEVQLTVTKSETGVQAHAAHRLWFSPDSVVVKAGERLKLMCIFGGRPVPQVTWSRLNGGELPKNRMRDLHSVDSDYGKSLIIDPVLPDDAGQYQCSAQGIDHIMTVQITAAPFWENETPPTDINQAEETTAEIRCDASGRPQPLIRWFFNGIRFDVLPDNPRRQILDSGRVLRIVDLNHDVDMGVYQCNASNAFGYVFANAIVTVRAHAPKFNMPSKRTFKLITHANIDMSCDVDSAPEPIVRWVDARDFPITIVPGKVELFPNHTLRIRDVSLNDAGVYYCNVSNKYGLNRASNHLQVFNPSYFSVVPSPEKLTLEMDESYELNCHAQSDHRLTIDYEWMLNGKAINFSDTSYTLIQRNRLQLTNARGRHSGYYVCVAISDVDRLTSGMELIVRDVPESPIITNIDCNERRAMIIWLRSQDNYDKLLHYIVEMRTDFDQPKDRWRQVLIEEHVDKDSFEADITLSPWVNYTFRVIAVNSHGKSAPGVMPNVRCNTKPSFPYMNPTNVTASGTEPNNLVVYWQPMPKEDWNANQFIYVIRYRLSEPGTDWIEFKVEDPMANHTIIRDQPTYREYMVQVRAANAIGESIVDPITVIGYSGEDKPTYSPEGFQLVEIINATTIRFSWQHVDEKSVNGYFKGYKIQTWLRYQSHKTRRRHTDIVNNYLHNFVVSADVNSIVVHGFAPMTAYRARIFTVNRRYASEPSVPIDFETPEGVPSIVHNMQVRAVGATTILVGWEPPREPNGIIRGYYLSFENSSSGHIEETFVLNRRLAYLHEGAKSDSEYRVSVWAETNGGEGPKVVKSVRTWPIRDPATPQFEISMQSTTSAKFTWIPPTESSGQMPGSAFYLNYTDADNGDEWIQTEVQNLPNRELQLDDLRPNRRYWVYMIVRDGNRSSISELRIVDTNDHHLVDPHVSLQTSAWFIAVVSVVALALLSMLVVCVCQQRAQSGRYAVKKKEMQRGHVIIGDVTDEERSFMEYQQYHETATTTIIGTDKSAPSNC